jgi:hypothetical protein
MPKKGLSAATQATELLFCEVVPWCCYLTYVFEYWLKADESFDYCLVRRLLICPKSYCNTVQLCRQRMMGCLVACDTIACFPEGGMPCDSLACLLECWVLCDSIACLPEGGMAIKDTGPLPDSPGIAASARLFTVSTRPVCKTNLNSCSCLTPLS